MSHSNILLCECLPWDKVDLQWIKSKTKFKSYQMKKYFWWWCHPMTQSSRWVTSISSGQQDSLLSGYV